MTGTGGPVTGTPDTHCGAKVQAVSLASCHPDGGTSADSGMPMGDGGVGMDFGATMFGSEGDDDDCKIHLKWSAVDACQNTTGATFTVTATRKSDGKPFSGGAPYLEAFLTDGHPAPSAGTAKETSPGVYAIGPVTFDAKGQWTVRFHFYSDCEDGAEDSPHTHGAFFVTVP